MENLYICYTKYQLLITLLKVDKNKKNTLLTLFELKNYEKENIIKYNLFEEIIEEKETNFLYFKPDKIAFCIKKYIFFKRFINIYLFLDHRIVGAFLNKFRIKYHLLEDGYDFYKLKSKKEKVFIQNYKQKIYEFFLNPSSAGLGKYVIDIEVNDKEGLENHPRYNKMIEVSRKKMFENITEAQKEMLFDIFNFKKIDFENNSKKIIIITQPLWQDGEYKEKILTELDQFKFYKNIVEKYKDEYRIYFKVHPRDMTDYTSIKDVIFLDKNVPIELYQFSSKFKFDIAITYSSTSIKYLDFIEQKIILKTCEKNYE